MSDSSSKPLVLAYSGGLDTSYCIAHYTRNQGRRVVAAIVDTGGISDEDAAELERRALALGAESFTRIRGKHALADRVIRYLVAGNVRRGETYPLCVAAERVIQAEELVKFALTQDASEIAHGSTGAGNDQIRFEVAIRALAPDIEALAPVRDMGLKREDEIQALRDWGLEEHLSKKNKAAYSINDGLWGTSIGGRETTGSTEYLPDDAWFRSVNPATAPEAGLELEIGFSKGFPTSLDGQSLDAVSLIEKLTELGNAHGVGRGIHLGDTIIGIKGRVAYEAPAAEILLPAHRELEKLVLSRHQLRVKALVSGYYGNLVHESAFFDPAARDIEALLESSQSQVNGMVRVKLCRGQVTVLGYDSPSSMMNPEVATYGEVMKGYSGADAAGFARILGNASRIIARSRR